jgi:hypothetical protein
MKKNVNLILEFVIVICLLSNTCVAQSVSSVKISSAQLRRDLASTNGTVRFQLAENLALDHSKATFTALLKLLKDNTPDVVYRAAESIEARKDTTFTPELVAAIKAIPKDNRWPIYRAARSYPTESMLDFLKKCLIDEIQFQNHRNTFDNRNCFYLCKSLEQIVSSIRPGAKIAAPEDGDLSAYVVFANSLKQTELDTPTNEKRKGVNP